MSPKKKKKERKENLYFDLKNPKNYFLDICWCVKIHPFLYTGDPIILDTTESSHDVIFIISKLAETDTPGLFKVWAVVGSDLHCIKVNVPRIFYVNCHTPKEGSGTSKLQFLTKLFQAVTQGQIVHD